MVQGEISTMLSRAMAREIDAIAAERFGMPTLLLMENAGRSAAEMLLRLGVKGRVVILAGKGNNGGDGFVIARFLELAGVQVEVLLLGKRSELKGDAAVQAEIAHRSGIIIHEHLLKEEADLPEVVQEADIFVDSIFGTGLSTTLRPPFVHFIHQVNDLCKSVYAIDLPSGLDCDSGMPLGAAIKAKVPLTFVASKQGFTNPASQQYTGEVHIASIGIPAALLREFNLEMPKPS